MPRALAFDRDEGMALYSFAPGRRIRADEIDQELIDAALDLATGINDPALPRAGLPNASDACFSLAEHIDCTERRLVMLQALDGEEAIVRDARALVEGELMPFFTHHRDRVIREASALGLAIDAPIGPEARCLSPSDFGFHNALVDDQGRVSFVDFEYAGWDDPAKMVCDFFGQVAEPVPLRFYAGFADRLAKALGLDDEHRRRIDGLLPIHRLKWVCMILQVFLPDTRRRRRFAGQDTDAPGRLAARFDEAKAMFGRLRDGD